MISLRQRFKGFWFLGLVLSFGLQWALAVWCLDQSTEAYILSRLKHDLESLQLALNFDPNGLPSMSVQELNPTFQRPFSGHYYHLQIHGIDLYSASLWQAPLEIPPLTPGGQVVREQNGPLDQQLLVYAVDLQVAGQNLQIAVAEDISPLKATLRQFSGMYALLSLSLLGLLLALQAWLLRRTLAPLQVITEQIEALLHGKRQALDETVPGEVLPLVEEFNRLLQILERRLTRSRNALSNLAHALKKPLGRMQRLLETAGSLDLEQRKELNHQSQAIQQLIEHELRRGQLAGLAPAGEQVDLAQEIPLLIRLLHSSYPEHKLQIQLDFPPNASVLADRQDLLELCGNVLDNAFKWARTKIHVNLVTGSGFSFVVEDDGPGCPESELSLLLERGTRLDRSQPGHGFGLAIVQEIAQAYGGQLVLGRSESLGGLRVEVQWPV